MSTSNNTLHLNSFTYTNFKEHVKELFLANKATGEDHSESKLEATKLNLQRIKRLDKTAKVSEDLVSKIESLNRPWKWVLILEGWCGDGAQITPYIDKLANLSQQIDLEIILRDENPAIMDKYLTNGARSIPMLICFDANTEEELGYWGPRPSAVIDWISRFKKDMPNYSKEEFNHGLHAFYAKDKGSSINNSLLNAVQKWM